MKAAWVNIGKKADLKMSSVSVGIIAEDKSDVECIKILARKIADKKPIAFPFFSSRGSGDLRNIKKVSAWSKALFEKGCKYLLLVHDLDQRNYRELYKTLVTVISASIIPDNIICIPVQEIEAWFLSDEAAILAFCHASRLSRKIPANPENIDSPKEYLRKLIYDTSKNKISFIEIMNQKLADFVNIEQIIAKCPSFSPLKELIDGI
jgi:hypothetical protein